MLFISVFVLPLIILTVISLNRTSLVANQNIQKDLNSAVSIFRDSLEDRLDTLKLRAKTLTDFEINSELIESLNSKELSRFFENEMLKTDLDYIGLIEDRSIERLQVGKFSSDSLKMMILPAICHSSLNVNMYIINDEPWIFAGAMLTKQKLLKPTHLVFAQKLKNDFADKLKNLTGAEFSLYHNGKKLITTQMDAYARRCIGREVEHQNEKFGKLEIMNKSHTFIHDSALPNRLPDEIKIEVIIPNSEYEELGRKMCYDFLTFGLLGLILAVITGYVLSVNIAEPINHLATITTKVADGNLVVTDNINREDEIGILSKNFNNMVHNLQAERIQKEQRMQELNVLFEISNAVNLFTNSEELLKFVLSHAIEILNAERGSIMLLDDNTDELIIKVATGGRYRAVSSVPIKLGSGICGKVAFDGVGIICNEGFKDKRFKNFGSLMPVEDINSLICAPLKYKEGTIGVINIVNKKDSNAFIENDLRLLTLIGSQAAVTIENNKLYELSITDGMTKLFVHKYFQARLSEELLRARRYGLNLSLIMIDIDNFKKFNDTYGHQTGDEVIQKVASTIKETVRTGVDIPCRYGGEEMCIILPETKSEEAFLTAERVRRNISSFVIPHTSGELHVTVSVGIASYPIHATDSQSLIKASDDAMYSSKKSGKNRCTEAKVLKL